MYKPGFKSSVGAVAGDYTILDLAYVRAFHGSSAAALGLLQSTGHIKKERDVVGRGGVREKT